MNHFLHMSVMDLNLSNLNILLPVQVTSFSSVTSSYLTEITRLLIRSVSKQGGGTGWLAVFTILIAGVALAVFMNSFILFVLEDLLTRSFKTRPDFLGIAGGAGKDLVQTLKDSGVTFPEGASATFIKASGTFLVTNTASNLSMIEAVVEADRNR